jgi:hypothetical protein
MDNPITKRVYYLFLFLSLIALVFYAGFLFGTREKVNSQDDLISGQNPNGQNLNTISRIQQRSVEGSTNAQTVETFGQMFFLVNKRGQTEIVINLERIPEKIVKPDTKREVIIPTQLQVDVARKVRDPSGQDTYVYENLSQNKDIKATISFNEAINGVRTATFSGYINEQIGQNQTGRGVIERVVLRSSDPDVQNIFIDPNPDLPVKIRGNAELKIPGQPAPFFWIRL